MKRFQLEQNDERAVPPLEYTHSKPAKDQAASVLFNKKNLQLWKKNNGEFYIDTDAVHLSELDELPNKSVALQDRLKRFVAKFIDPENAGEGLGFTVYRVGTWLLLPSQKGYTASHIYQSLLYCLGIDISYINAVSDLSDKEKTHPSVKALICSSKRNSAFPKASHKKQKTQQVEPVTVEDDVGTTPVNDVQNVPYITIDNRPLWELSQDGLVCFHLAPSVEDAELRHRELFNNIYHNSTHPYFVYSFGKIVAFSLIDADIMPEASLLLFKSILGLTPSDPLKHMEDFWHLLPSEDQARLTYTSLKQAALPQLQTVPYSLTDNNNTHCSAIDNLPDFTEDTPPSTNIWRPSQDGSTFYCEMPDPTSARALSEAISHVVAHMGHVFHRGNIVAVSSLDNDITAFDLVVKSIPYVTYASSHYASSYDAEHWLQLPTNTRKTLNRKINSPGHLTLFFLNNPHQAVWFLHENQRGIFQTYQTLEGALEKQQLLATIAPFIRTQVHGKALWVKDFFMEKDVCLLLMRTGIPLERYSLNPLLWAQASTLNTPSVPEGICQLFSKDTKHLWKISANDTVAFHCASNEDAEQKAQLLQAFLPPHFPARVKAAGVSLLISSTSSLPTVTLLKWMKHTVTTIQAAKERFTDSQQSDLSSPSPTTPSWTERSCLPELVRSTTPVIPFT